MYVLRPLGGQVKHVFVFLKLVYRLERPLQIETFTNRDLYK